MIHNFLRLFICACLLLQQAPAFAAGPLPLRRTAQTAEVGIGAPAKTDYLGNQIDAAVRRQIGEAQGDILQIKNLDARARAALEKGDAAKFYFAEKELNALLIKQLSSRTITNRLYALERLAANIREGLIAPEDEKAVYALLEAFLRGQKVCGGTFCDVVGMSVLTLALSVNAAEQHPSVLLSAELPMVPARQSRRAALQALFLSLLARDYGSAEANNAVASYALRALGHTGGAAAVHQALQELIKQSKKVSVLWGAATVNTDGLYLHLNKYDVPNAPAQKAAIQVLASLGEPGKKVLEYYAAENHSLASHVHANIELAYLGPTQVPVQKNLENLYCSRKWRLDAQKDFELRQEIGYAYGRGRAPAYVSQMGDCSCKVLVPQRPDPRLQVKEWTDAIGAEVLFNAAFMGAGNLFKILRHAKAMRAYARTRHGMSLREFFHKGGMHVLPRFGAAAQKQQIVAGNILGMGAEHTRVMNEINSLKQLPLSAPQKVKLAKLERQFKKNPFVPSELGRIKRQVQTLPTKTVQAINVQGPGLSPTTEHMANNFIFYTAGKRTYRPIWGPKNQTRTLYGTTMKKIDESFNKLGPLSDELFVSWDTHGALENGKWLSFIGDKAYTDIEEMTAFFQRLRASGRTREITCYLSSCYSGSAFDEFLSLPANLREGINLFAPAGGPLQLAYGIAAPTAGPGILSPLQYAKKWWLDSVDSFAASGRGYVRGIVLDPLRQTITRMQYMHEPFLFRDLSAYEKLARARTSQELLRAYDALPTNFCGVEILKKPGKWDAFSFQMGSWTVDPTVPTVSWPKYLLEHVKQTIRDYPF